MDTTPVIAEIEAAVATQLDLAGGDGPVDVAAQAFLAAMRPAVAAAAMKLAEQAANEVAAQLPDSSVDVVLSDGEPTLRVRRDAAPPSFAAEELDARLTLRLPPTLKSELEDAAGDTGDSVNAFVIKALSGTGKSKSRYRKQTSGTIDT
ncbi:MAG: toxin-antitoxin system HicB family antitoxin [Acidimicrobiia bacterium]